MSTSRGAGLKRSSEAEVFIEGAGMKVLSKHLHPDLRRVGEHGVGQTVGLMGEVFRNIILPVV